MKIYLVRYKSDVLSDRTYIVMSSHKTQKGAEKAIELHKSEMQQKDEEQFRKLNKINQTSIRWDMWKDWKIQELELLD